MEAVLSPSRAQLTNPSRLAPEEEEAESRAVLDIAKTQFLPVVALSEGSRTLRGLDDAGRAYRFVIVDRGTVEGSWIDPATSRPVEGRVGIQRLKTHSAYAALRAKQKFVNDFTRAGALEWGKRVIGALPDALRIKTERFADGATFVLRKTAPNRADVTVFGKNGAVEEAHRDVVVANGPLASVARNVELRRALVDLTAAAKPWMPYAVTPEARRTATGKLRDGRRFKLVSVGPELIDVTLRKRGRPVVRLDEIGPHELPSPLRSVYADLRRKLEATFSTPI